MHTMYVYVCAEITLQLYIQRVIMAGPEHVPLVKKTSFHVALKLRVVNICSMQEHVSSKCCLRIVDCSLPFLLVATVSDHRNTVLHMYTHQFSIHLPTWKLKT